MHDPILLLKPLTELCKDYNKDSWRIINSFKRWWVLNITYPLFRRKVFQSESFTAELLFKHPEALILVVTRYFLYLISYSKMFDINPHTLVASIFPSDMIHMDMDTTTENNNIRLDAIHMVIRSAIVLNLAKPEDDKYAITTINIDTNHQQYDISQICYDNNSAFMSKTSKILYNKEFRLSSDGTLINPNYILNKGLLDDDLNYYRLIISQVMIFLGGLIDSTTTVFFFDKPKNNDIL